MSDYYHQFLSSITGVGGTTTPGRQDIPLPPQPPPGMALGVPPMPNAYQSLGYFTGFPDPLMYTASPSSKASQKRRKSAPGLDHIKHRRTRSGCFTCRSRRVKCDETHPICERCRKGKRECNYPEPPAPRSASSTSHPSAPAAAGSELTSPTSSHDEEDDDSDTAKLDTIFDEDEPGSPLTQAPRSSTGLRRASTASALTLQRPGVARQGSETPSLEGAKSSSPTGSTATTGSLAAPGHSLASGSSFAASGVRTDWSQLSPDIRSYLAHFCDHMTHHHYCIAQDNDEFFRVILPNIAVRNEHLLYAVVGFAAYNRTLQDPNGKIQEFLHYYNKSVTLLLQALKRKDKHNVSILLTILQLATIEEYLGDWVNLMGHQRAALEILMSLYTPQTAMQSPTSRMIMAWYERFDVFVALMGGFEAALPAEWFSSPLDFWQKKAASEPENLSFKIEELAAKLRMISRDMALLFARNSRGTIGEEEFVMEHSWLSDRLDAWRAGWDPALRDSSHLVSDFTNKQPSGPFEPGVIHDFPLFPLTILESEWHSLMIMHKSQAPQSTDLQELQSEVADHAIAICQTFEAVEQWPMSPPGSLVALYAGLAVSALFLPRDAKHEMWLRRKFAKLETMGYVFPLTMRERMAELFRDPSCTRWWLPDDEAFSPILKSVRTFADERNATAVTAQSDKLRDARQIFAKLQLGIIGTSTETGKPQGAGAATAGVAGTSSAAASTAARQGASGRTQAKDDSSASDNHRLDIKGKGPNTSD